MFSRILVVCVGNICRSPMAAAVLSHRVSAAGRKVTVESAGLAALVGHPADEMAQTLMAERGLDIGEHRARQLTAEMLRDFELVLVMESEQQRSIESTYP